MLLLLLSPIRIGHDVHPNCLELGRAGASREGRKERKERRKGRESSGVLEREGQGWGRGGGGGGFDGALGELLYCSPM